MSLQNKKEELEKQEKKAPVPERPERFAEGGIETPEKREAEKEDELVVSELRKEIDMMELDDKAKAEAEKKAKKIEFLGEKEKIEHLLEMARKKGVLFAIQVARKMNEPYLLDILHDTLAQEGFYKKIKPTDNDDDNNKKQT